MKKTINKKVYNTDTAKKLGQFASGFFGDPAGYEEILYVTKKGAYFLHCNGGDASKYPAETIIALTDAEANEWIDAHQN